MMQKKKTPIEWKELFDSKEFKEEYYYHGKDLGAVYSKEKTVFKLWAPTAQRVDLNLYKEGDPHNKEAFIKSLSLNRGEKGVWSCEIDGDISGLYYTYTVEVLGEKKETADIYSRAVGVNGKRSMVIDLEKTNPEGWKEDFSRTLPWDRPIIYEVHIRDFSSDINSGVSGGNRGRYKAFTEKNTTLRGEGKVPTCTAYLKELGINYVHLLPSYDYESIDESDLERKSFNWGYDPQNYNVPEGSYSSNPFDGAVRIKEFKEMVKALHEEGMGVILDVVYNHTYSIESSFQNTLPYYYYRINDDGSLSNGSGCGNDTASERAMFRKFIIESVCYWATEYHIDGFRFDLMGLHDVETMNEVRKALDNLPGGEKILIYGEPWQCSVTNMAEGSKPAVKNNIHLLDERIAIFCDDTRDAIKGSVFIEKEPGFVNGGENLEENIKGAVTAFCDGNKAFKPKNPGQIISYVSAHDNFTLWDKLNYTEKEYIDKESFYEYDEEIIKMNKLSAAIYFTSLGIPFFQAGEEGARTKEGIGDSYKSSIKINQLDWERIYTYKSLVDYYRGLINIRKSFRAFDSRDNTIVNNISFLETNKSSVVAYEFRGIGGSEEKWSKLMVVYNASNREFKIPIKEEGWTLLLDGEKDYLKEASIPVIGELIVPEKTALILGFNGF